MLMFRLGNDVRLLVRNKSFGTVFIIYFYNYESW